MLNPLQNLAAFSSSLPLGTAPKFQNLLFRNIQLPQYFQIMPMQMMPQYQQQLQYYRYPQLQFKILPNLTPNIQVQQQIEKKQPNINKEKYSRSVLIKNCARYLIRNIIKSLHQFEETIQEIFHDLNPNYQDKFSFDDFAQYFTKNIDIFTSIQVIRKHWISQESNTQEQNCRNDLFRQFCKYYLKEKSYRYVLGGKMKMKKYYLRTIRQMLKHIDNAEQYKSNFY